MPNEEEYQKWYNIAVRKLFTADKETCRELKQQLNDMGMPSWWPHEFAKREGFKL